MKNLNVNHLAVWASIILLTVLGFLWYGPIFGDKWMGLVGLDPATVEANPPGAGIWITNIIATVIPMYALAWFFDKLNVRTWSDGIIYGLLISFAFHFLSNMTGDMFAQRPYGLSWITGGYTMVALAISGAILGAWRKYAG